MKARSTVALAVFLLASCATERGWVKANTSQEEAADDLLACWSLAIDEAQDQFAEERQWQKLALLNIRVLQTGEIRIDDDFKTLMVELDEVRWRGERFRECMQRRGYANSGGG